MEKFKTMDANEAVARVTYKFTELAGISDYSSITYGRKC